MAKYNPNIVKDIYPVKEHGMFEGNKIIKEENLLSYKYNDKIYSLDTGLYGDFDNSNGGLWKGYVEILFEDIPEKEFELGIKIDFDGIHVLDDIGRPRFSSSVDMAMYFLSRYAGEEDIRVTDLSDNQICFHIQEYDPITKSTLLFVKVSSIPGIRIWFGNEKATMSSYNYGPGVYYKYLGPENFEKMFKEFKVGHGYINYKVNKKSITLQGSGYMYLNGSFNDIKNLDLISGVKLKVYSYVYYIASGGLTYAHDHNCCHRKGNKFNDIEITNPGNGITYIHPHSFCCPDYKTYNIKSYNKLPFTAHIMYKAYNNYKDKYVYVSDYVIDYNVYKHYNFNPSYIGVFDKSIVKSLYYFHFGSDYHPYKCEWYYGYLRRAYDIKIEYIKLYTPEKIIYKVM